jgi:hypothetical protein
VNAKAATFFFLLGVAFCASTHGVIPPNAERLQAETREAILAPSHARMPQKFIQKELKDLKVGESCYTVPWGMWVDSKGNCWLNPNYSASDNPGGTVQMYVTRKSDGYYVNISRCKDHGWQRVTRPSYAGQNGPWIPVVRMTE